MLFAGATVLEVGNDTVSEETFATAWYSRNPRDMRFATRPVFERSLGAYALAEFHQIDLEALLIGPKPFSQLPCASNSSLACSRIVVFCNTQELSHPHAYTS